MSYIGRFAPSPTGLLHFGSLLAALASYLEARSQRGQWLLRIEDLDTPRLQAGASAATLQTLQNYGFEWDEPVIYQSQRLAAYQQALDALQADSFGCTCSRKQLQSTAAIGPYGLIYPGTCRNQAPRTTHSVALRLRVPDQIYRFHDHIQGEFTQNLAQELGDFVIRRTDGIIAYQLAVVVDDAWQGITHIVRGSDLLDNTPRQLYLQQLLGYQTPSYAHIPVATNTLQQKLSKQTYAPALTTRDTLQNLCKAWNFLGQLPQLPQQTDYFTGLTDFWDWSINHWHLARVPTVMSLPLAE